MNFPHSQMCTEPQMCIRDRDKAICEKVTSECGFGGGCINDVIIHLATSEMPFGGFGESGMGSYHGQKGFETFSHYKSIVDKKTWIDLPMRYQPYRRIYDCLLYTSYRLHLQDFQNLTQHPPSLPR